MAKKAPTADEKRFMAWVASLPCMVCEAPSTVHHVTAGIYGGRISRSHQRVANLCPVHHQIQWGPHESVEALGHGGFHQRYGINLLREAEGLWEEWCGKRTDG